MRGRPLLAPCLSLVFLALTTTAVQGSPDTWWTTRGRTPSHANAVVEAAGDLAYAWELADTGLSASQPLYLNGRIYHLTETGLWEIDPDNPNGRIQLVPGTTINRVGDQLRPPTAGLTYAEVGASRTPYLYFGTGANDICAYGLQSRTWRCRRLQGDLPIVSTPLVWSEHDTALMGDKDGYLWAVKGLSTPNFTPLARAFSRQLANGVPMWLTASPTPVSQSSTQLDFLFSAYVEGGGIGYVGRARLSLDKNGRPLLTVAPLGAPANGLWTSQLPVGQGMADGFALNADSTFAYVTDLRGTMYRINVNEGWLEKIPPPTPNFANDLAAIGPGLPARNPAGATVYFTMRNQGRITPDYDTPGSVIAVDLAPWKFLAEHPIHTPAAKLGAANTPPLVWGSRIIVGTTGGYLYIYDANSAAAQAPLITDLPAAFPQTVPAGAGPAIRRLLKDGELPFRAAAAYQALSGAGVQPILASGGTGQALLLMGVNYCPAAGIAPDGVSCLPGQGKGRLIAFRAQADDPAVTLLCPARATLAFPATAVVSFRSAGSRPFDGQVRLTWRDADGATGVETRPVYITPGGPGARVNIHVDQAAPGQAVVRAELLLPSGFRDQDTDNNTDTCTIDIQDCPECAPPPPTGSGSVLIGP